MAMLSRRIRIKRVPVHVHSEMKMDNLSCILSLHADSFKVVYFWLVMLRSLSLSLFVFFFLPSMIFEVRFVCRWLEQKEVNTIFVFLSFRFGCLRVWTMSFQVMQRRLNLIACRFKNWLKMNLHGLGFVLVITMDTQRYISRVQLSRKGLLFSFMLSWKLGWIPNRIHLFVLL